MKYRSHSSSIQRQLSLPVRGAWVEMYIGLNDKDEKRQSLPVRGAWVEIMRPSSSHSGFSVAPRAGSVG